MRRILALITPEARPLVASVALLAGVGGLLSGALVALGNQAIQELTPGSLLIAGFVGAGLGKLVSSYFAEVLLTRFCLESVARIRKNLITSILDVPLKHYETIGSPRVFACLTEDVGMISRALAALPGVAINVAIVFGAGIYLVILSPSTFAILAAGALAGLMIYRTLAKSAIAHWALARDTGDSIHEQFRTFTSGVKELKMNAPRRERFLKDSLSSATGRYADQCVSATRRYTLAHSVSHFLLFLLIAVLLFVLPRFNILPDEALSGYVLTCLFLLSPISGIVHIIPSLARAGIARRKIAGLGVDLETESPEVPATSPLNRNWKNLSLRGATFHYQGAGTRSFTAGPLDLEIQRGELLFITGPNGSGKTTLGKMIAGLYEPDQGTLNLDETKIDFTNRDAYRQHLSVVFSDFHLFGDLEGLKANRIDKHTRDYLRQLGLDGAVRISESGRLSTTTALSTGQKKRLALLAAYVEDRDILIFDEWAADQDPEFRTLFYEKLLPELNAMGKTLIVITHDDRYFHCAQRLIKLIDGKLVDREIKRVAAEPKDPQDGTDPYFSTILVTESNSA
jgi:putative ATP-binding cassette transporter